MLAQPTYSPRLHRWFARYLRRYFARNFTGVRVARSGARTDGLASPVVVFSNHASWWDPILYMLVAHERFPGRPGYGPMDARALEKYRFFRRLGVFGVEQDSRRGAATFLRTARAVLARPGAMLWMTAEGGFNDPRRRPVRFRRGLGHLARALDGAWMLPLAIEYPFWNERHPEALLRFGEPIRVVRGDAHDADEWTAKLERALEATQDALREDAVSRDPARFERLVSGEAGVGGVYDLWRRIQSGLRGRPFRAAHGDAEP